MKILAFGASLRNGSYNKKLARVAAEILTKELGASAEYVDFRDYSMPVYDGDLEDSDGQPRGAVALAAKIRAVSALVISTPEYNGSIPGVFKNAIDWLSRDDEPSVCLKGKPLLLLAASPGALGGIRSLWHTRVPLEAVGAHVYPNMFGMPKADQAFDDSGVLKDASSIKRLTSTLKEFVEFARKFD